MELYNAVMVDSEAEDILKKGLWEKEKRINGFCKGGREELTEICKKPFEQKCKTVEQNDEGKNITYALRVRKV